MYTYQQQLLRGELQQQQQPQQQQPLHQQLQQHHSGQQQHPQHSVLQQEQQQDGVVSAPLLPTVDELQQQLLLSCGGGAVHSQPLGAPSAAQQQQQPPYQISAQQQQQELVGGPSQQNVGLAPQLQQQHRAVSAEQQQEQQGVGLQQFHEQPPRAPAQQQQRVGPQQLHPRQHRVAIKQHHPRGGGHSQQRRLPHAFRGGLQQHRQLHRGTQQQQQQTTGPAQGLQQQHHHQPWRMTAPHQQHEKQPNGDAEDGKRGQNSAVLPVNQWVAASLEGGPFQLARIVGTRRLRPPAAAAAATDPAAAASPPSCFPPPPASAAEQRGPGAAAAGRKLAAAASSRGSRRGENACTLAAVCAACSSSSSALCSFVSSGRRGEEEGSLSNSGVLRCRVCGEKIEAAAAAAAAAEGPRLPGGAAESAQPPSPSSNSSGSSSSSGYSSGSGPLVVGQTCGADPADWEYYVHFKNTNRRMDCWLRFDELYPVAADGRPLLLPSAAGSLSAQRQGDHTEETGALLQQLQQQQRRVASPPFTAAAVSPTRLSETRAATPTRRGRARVKGGFSASAVASVDAADASGELPAAAAAEAAAAATGEEEQRGHKRPRQDDTAVDAEHEEAFSEKAPAAATAAAGPGAAATAREALLDSSSSSEGCMQLAGGGATAAPPSPAQAAATAAGAAAATAAGAAAATAAGAAAATAAGAAAAEAEGERPDWVAWRQRLHRFSLFDPSLQFSDEDADPEEHEGMDKATLLAHEEATKIKTIRHIQIGGFLLKTWYFSPYPAAAQHAETLFICEFCLSFFVHARELAIHARRCVLRHPPGDEIYRDGKLSVFEVDGSVARVYSENLCFLAKLFLDHKTLQYDVDPFLFYVLTEVDRRGCHLIGYFSKEKVSLQGYNLACILTLPQHQRKGYGRFLIAFSYLLSKREKKRGGPERPLSDLGRVSYSAWWRACLLTQLQQHVRREQKRISIEDLVRSTAIRAEDVQKTLEEIGVLRYVQGHHLLLLQPDLVKTLLAQAGEDGVAVHAENLHFVSYYRTPPGPHEALPVLPSSAAVPEQLLHHEAGLSCGREK